MPGHFRLSLILGKGVSVVTEDAEMTTQQAADFLHVSRPYVVKLLNQGKIPYCKIGVRRRIRLEDVLHYRDDTGDAASQALDELTAENRTRTQAKAIDGRTGYYTSLLNNRESFSGKRLT